MKELKSQKKSEEVTQRLAREERAPTTPRGEGTKGKMVITGAQRPGHPGAVGTIQPVQRQGHRAGRVAASNAAWGGKTLGETAFPPPSTFPIVPPFGHTQTEARAY